MRADLYEKLLPGIYLKGTALFSGDRTLEESETIRRALNSLNGDFALSLEETADLPYEVNLVTRELRGLRPMSVEELIYYFLCAVPCFLTMAYASFVRDVVLEWVSRSAIYSEIKRVEALLDDMGVC